MSATRIIGVHKMAGTALTVPAIKKHTATVIMAHGLGDRCAAFSPPPPTPPKPFDLTPKMLC
jgi:hypothetical protein